MKASRSSYTHRIAIANSRLVGFDGERVTFKWKDYRAKGDACYKLMTLEFNLGNINQAITSFTAIHEGFSAFVDADHRYWQARALVNKGVTLSALGRGEDEIAVYNDLLARFGTATELPLREVVAKAESAKDTLRKS